MDDDVKKLYRLDDAAYVLSRLDEQKPEGVENESVEQAVFALNKRDLLLAEQLKTEMGGLEPVF